MSKSTVTLFRFICQSVLLAYGCFAIEVQHTGHFLKFENRSNYLVKGCFHKNINLAVCFHIQPGFIQLTDKRNKPLVKYRKLPNQRFHAQILDQNFVWYHSAAEPLFITAAKKAHVPSDAEIQMAYGLASNALRDISPALYQSAVENLRRIQEIQLLPRISKALHDGTKDYAITEPFHVMAMSLLAGHDVSTTRHDPETAGSYHNGYLKHRDDTKRGTCKDLRRDPYKNDCLGMCGPKCSCWSWICGDCCKNKGCYQHDLCCLRKHSSGYCLLPFLHHFRCNSYGGYPDCLKKL